MQNTHFDCPVKFLQEKGRHFLGSECLVSLAHTIKNVVLFFIFILVFKSFKFSFHEQQSLLAGLNVI